MIKRLLEERIKEQLFKGKTIILYGARQVGKTTLVQNILKNFGNEGRYLNCEILSIEENLKIPEPERLKAFLGNYRLIVLDEAQNIPNIGRILKILNDSFPEIQIIATGSSSFDLATKAVEPMTGRALFFILYPLSALELKEENDWFYFESKIETLLRFGSYPEIFLSNENEALLKLNTLASSYLYKDLLKYNGIKKTSILKNLLISLALQIGNEVSYNELAIKLGINSITVQKYLDLLEQCFVILRLHSFSRNLRNEITKSLKVYFYDLGIRNSLVQNFNTLSLRNDIGALWENFCVVERLKSNSSLNRNVNYYFWRTYSQKEVDYVEEFDGKIIGYEFKFSGKQKSKQIKEFKETYNAEIIQIDKTNFWKFAELKV